MAQNLQLHNTRKVFIGSWDIRSTEVVIIQLPAVEDNNHKSNELLVEQGKTHNRETYRICRFGNAESCGGRFPDKLLLSSSL